MDASIDQFAGYQDWRFSIFLGVFVAMGLLETLLPRKERVQPRGRRFMTNVGIAIVDTVVMRILFPAAAVGAALWAEQGGFGLLHVSGVPSPLAAIAAFVLLDFAIWLQHVASHKIPILWRVHKVHHADRDLDASSGIRFHPVEIVLSMIYKIGIVVLLGAPALAVFVFEVVLNASSLFNHANLRIPLWLERKLRWVIVTPDMHRVHHSVLNHETDSNYGFNLSIWDRVFGTYVDQPEKGHDGMTLGLSESQGPEPSTLLWSLLLPFRRKSQ